MSSIMPIQQSHSSKRGFPIWLFAAAFVASLLTTVFSTWQSWQMHTRFEEMSAKHLDVTKKIGRIVLLDEMLTMSARMAAATGDFSYEKRYDQFDPELTALINDVRANLPQTEIGRFIGETDEANLALVKLERQAFALTHQGRRQEATALLISDEYMRLKKVYAGGMEKTADAVALVMERDDRHLHSLTLFSAVVSAMGILLLLVTWFFAARSVRSWATERREVEDALQKARDELEVRVKQRTADLLSANQQLQHEIAEHKHTEESLRKLSLAVEQSPSSVVITDLNANIEYANAAFTKTTGYSLAEVIGHNSRILHSGKTPKASYVDMWAHLKRSEVWKGEFINRRKDGGEFIESVLMSPVRQADGRVTHYLAIKEDITIRKLAEESLKNLAAKFHAVFELSADAIMLLGEKVLFDCNPATLRLFGCSTRDDFIGKHPAELSPPIQPGGEVSLNLANEHIATAIKNGSNLFEWMHRRFDGTDFPAEVLLTALELDGKPVLQATVRDITKRKQAEAKLAEQVAELRRWHDVTSGREGRILDLKHEVNDLLSQIGKQPRYPSAESQDEIEE